MSLFTLFLFQVFFYITRSQEDYTPLCTNRDYPFAATLAKLSDGVLFCGGVLLTGSTFLSTSSCVASISRPNDYIVLGGSTYLQRVLVRRIVMHPYYDPKTLENDFAVIVLLGRIYEMEMPRLAGPGFTNHCHHVTMVAWDANRMNKQHLIPMQLPELFCMESKLMSKDACHSTIVGKYAKYTEILCAMAGDTGEHPCLGDRGGPLMCGDVIIGMSSGISDCERLFTETTFIFMEQHIEFIRETLAEFNFHVLRRDYEYNYPVYYAARNCWQRGVVLAVEWLLALMCFLDLIF